MKKRFRVIAVLSLVCGLASAGFGLWAYLESRSQAGLSRMLQAESFDLEVRSDTVKGTPEEENLVRGARRLEQLASEALASAKKNSQRAVILGVASIILILASVATMTVHLRMKATDSS